MPISVTMPRSPCVQRDEVADLVRPVREDEDAREEVRQRVAGRETDREPGDAARGEEARDVGAPDRDCQVGAEQDDCHLGQVLEEGLGVTGDETAPLPAAGYRPEQDG